RAPYKDRVTGVTIQPVTTGQIYWGAVPFVLIQILMIGLTITFPSMVMRYKAGEVHIDPNTIQIQAPDSGTGAPDFNTGTPNFGSAPAPTGGEGTPTPQPEGGAPAGPNFGT